MVGTLKARVGGAWVPVVGSGQDAANVARWNTAWGLVAWAQITADVSGIQTSDVTIVSIPSYTMTAGRRYMIKGETFVYKSAPDTAATVVARLIIDATIVQQRNFSVVAPGNGAVHLEMEYDAIGGPHGYYLKVNTAAGYVNIGAGSSYPTWLSIEDVGPTVPASIAPPTAGPRVVASGNALGIVAMGSFIPPFAPHTVAVNTETALTNPLPFFAAVGRRYRVRFQIRAITNTAGAGNTSFYLRDNGTVIRGWPYGGDPYIWSQGNYTGAAYDWLFEGDGLQHSVELLCNGLAAQIYLDYGLWYVEDVGPNTTPALPIPATPPAWTALTLINGYSTANGVTPQYRKIGDEVMLRGDVLSPSTASTTNLQDFATLPAGFRPPRQCQFPGVWYIGTFAPGVLVAKTNGNLMLALNAIIPASSDGNIDVVRFSTTP